MSEEQDSQVPQKEGEEEQEQRIERERQDLLARVASSELTTMGHRIAWLMNHYPDTRNSDIALQIRYWKTFENDIVKGDYVALDDLYTLPRLNSLVRARARIQNEYRLFQADPVVRERRGTLEEGERERAAETPDYPVYAVFLDESGKTSNNLIVGSLWFLSSGEESLALFLASNELKRKRRFTGEFHFSEIKKDEVPIYKDLIDIFVSKGGAISFKSISLERRGIKNAQVAFDDLYFHLLTKGIDHEVSTGRAPLPRILNVWKDLDEPGADKLLMANLEVKLKQAAASIYENRLIVEKCVAIDSKSNIFLQVADLVASSANRVLSRSGEGYNHKDELADYIVGCLGTSTNPGLDIPIGDLSVHIKL